MSEPATLAVTASRRRFWQLHLSTCLILMLAAGVLTWANVRPTFALVRLDGQTNCTGVSAHGWPMVAYIDFIDRIPTPQELNDAEFRGAPPLLVGRVVDGLCALGILLAVALPLEVLAGRKDRRPKIGSP
jgi:hypothetical protein